VDDPKTCEGYIILARAILDKSATWETSSPEQKVIIITLLLMANFQDKKWFDGTEEIIVKRGQLVTSLSGLQKKCGKGITVKHIRNSLVRLSLTNFLVCDQAKLRAKKYHLVTLVNYDFYQSQENYGQSNGQDLGQRVGKGRAITKEVKKVNNKDFKNTIVEFVAWFNAEFKTNYRVKTYEKNIDARLKEFSVDQLKQASLAMKRDTHMMGENDRHRVYATLEYITRSDQNVDKFLNLKEATTGGRNNEPGPDRGMADWERAMYQKGAATG